VEADLKTIIIKPNSFTLRALLLLICFAPLTAIQAIEPEYSHEVRNWQEIAVPRINDKASFKIWSYAANYSEYEWYIFNDGNKVRAHLTSDKPQNIADRPQFTPNAGRFRGGSAFAAVDDGWLVGFNQGEFGAALYWFSHDGKESYEVSNHQVVDFFTRKDGLYAIEGLAHLSLSEGSIIRISRPQPHAHWQASVVTTLPYAPYAISVRRDGTMLVTLSDELVTVSNDFKINTLDSAPLWRGLYPNSSVLDSDERKLYIGMRQYVGELDLSTKKFRFLIPSDSFLNKLPKKEEQRIRRDYGE